MDNLSKCSNTVLGNHRHTRAKEMRPCAVWFRTCFSSCPHFPIQWVGDERGYLMDGNTLNGSSGQWSNTSPTVGYCLQIGVTVGCVKPWMWACHAVSMTPCWTSRLQTHAQLDCHLGLRPQIYCGTLLQQLVTQWMHFLTVLSFQYPFFTTACQQPIT